MAFKFREPLVFQQGTGFIISPNNTELFGNVSPSQIVTFAIGQAVAPTSNTVFNQTTVSDKFIIDNGQTTHTSGEITGSLTLSSNFTAVQNLTGSGNLTILGTVTAEKIETELTQSVTLFESGSTQFGDTSDDTHQFSGSFLASGSLALNANTTREISNDTSLTDGSGVALVTENALKNYLDDNVDDIQTYLRKSFAYTGSFVNVSTSSFTVATASAPSGYTATSEDDFMFFINGQMMEHDALTIQQSSSYFYLKIDNDSIGYDLASADEIVAWGKFNS